MSIILKTICVILFAAITGIILSGAMYSWIDTAGIKHFSNVSPPESGEVQQLIE